MKRTQPLTLIIPFAGLLVVTGCTTPNASVQYTPPATVNPANTREANGLKITVDPMFDAARSKACFNADALGMGILPVHLRVENTNPNASFLLQKTNLQVLDAGVRTSNTTSNGVAVNSAGASAGGTVAVAGMLAGSVLVCPAVTIAAAPLLFTATISVGNAQAVQYNFAQAELRDQSLSPGQSVSGFVYFQIPKGHPPTKGILKLTASDLRTQQATQLEIPINQ